MPSTRPGSLKVGAQSLAAVAMVGLVGLLVRDLLREDGGVAAGVRAGTVVRAPDFALSRLDRDGTLRFSSLRGKVVVVNFWASWCLPCKKEASLLEGASRRWRSDGVVVLGVDGADDFPSRARAFIRRHRLTYPSVRDEDAALLRGYGVTGYPETFFVDRRGRVVGHVSGEISRAELEAGIAEALA
jgi:cytochrome c biogenesis protein CcmG, thiol:disulfide interchange protein DsbE